VNIQETITALLTKEIGLAPESIGGARTIAGAITQRMSALGLDDERRYVERLLESRAEVTALVEEIVVPETWFFRDREPFRFLGRVAAGTRVRPFRVLCVPCSTGEEAYSVSMALLQAGVMANQYTVEGVDVSSPLLERARRGVYTNNSFRGDDLAYRAAFFEQDSPTEWRLGALPRASVSFRQANLLQRASLDAGVRYQAIFCRNLLIYLERWARQQAIENLTSLLDDNGVLFVGHAEALDVMDRRYRPVEDVRAFAYVRAVDQPRLRSLTPSPRAIPVELTPRAIRIPVAPEPVKTPPAPVPVDLLKKAAELADRGDLLEAAEVVERHLREAKPDAGAYCLLGVILQASGQAVRAEEQFRKAVYLDPGHEESLTHLALLAERRGDATAAANYRRRAGRGGTR
jgi:chemotaxis protein methyltransferase WspC